MITRSTKHILKFQTKSKTNILDQLFYDFEQDLQNMIQYIIKNKLFKLKFGSNIPQFNLKHSRWSQIIYKQASEIVRSQIKFAEQKRFKHYQKIYSKCKKQNRRNIFLNKRFKNLNLKNIEKSKFFSIPNLKNLTITLDSRVIDFQMKSAYFDEFIQVTLPYFHETKKRALKLRLPINHYKYSLKFKDWLRKDSIRLRKINNKYFLDLIYEKDVPSLKVNGVSIGIDQGANKLISDSNGKYYGKELILLYNKIAHKNKKNWKKNKFYQNSSINKTKLLIHRDNEINRIVNEFFKENININQLVIEDLNDVKRYKFNMNKVKSWVYPLVINKLERFCQENGIQLTKVNPAYTSQTCSYCGTIDKKSRDREIYHCKSCNIKMDADTNAAINILRCGTYSYPSTKTEYISI